MTRGHNEIEAFRVQELLLARATEGLEQADADELAALGADHDASYDLAAAAVAIASVHIEDMPAGVADRILVAAGISPTPQQSRPTTLAGVVPPISLSRPAVTRPAPIDAVPARTRSRAPMIAAYVAAAAGIVLAIGAVLWARQQAPTVITKQVDRVVAPTILEPAAARAQLLATASDVSTLAWKSTGDDAAKAASGDVVWSASRQQGFMRFVGLAPNDPKLAQYQLWIFDKNRDEDFPVDGGVFDVGPNGEIIVPITAKLAVGQPVLFAVTVEKPGGVVVSKRERIVVTAAPG